MSDSSSVRLYDVAIVGAGAAGLATAAFLGRHNPSLSIALLEGAKKPGAKILVSGGSRCNVTNVSVSERDFWGGSRAAIRQVLRAFTVADTRAFFARLGITLHEEPNGKLFPDSNRARDVLEALLREIDDCRGVRLLTDHRVQAIGREAGSFALTTSRGPLRASSVVLATGGRALPKSGSDGAGYTFATALGHTLVETTPALAPLLMAQSNVHAEVSGVTHEAELSVWVDGRLEERLSGSLLWTHFGVSGPVALNASRVWARARLDQKDAAIGVNLLPASTFESLDARIVELARERPRAGLATILASLLPDSIVDAILKRLDIDRTLVATQLDRETRRRLVHALTAWPLGIVDTRGYTYAEATAGGVSLYEINPRTMASKVVPGLYLVGEVLDVDGRLGGFNFQWAWSSAWVAARALAGTNK